MPSLRYERSRRETRCLIGAAACDLLCRAAGRLRKRCRRQPASAARPSAGAARSEPRAAVPRGGRAQSRRGCSSPSATPADGWRKLTYAAARRYGRCAGAGAARARPFGRAAGDDPLRQRASTTRCSRSPATPPAFPSRRSRSPIRCRARIIAKLKHIAELLEPGLIYVADTAPFAKALAALDLHRRRDRREPQRRQYRRRPRSRIWRRAGRARRSRRPCAASRRRTRSPNSCSPPARPACPRASINTHGMLTANQQQLAQIWPFLDRAAAGAARLAAVEPHLRRQPQFQSGAAPCRHALHRRRPAAARPGRARPCAICARSRRRSISTCRPAMPRCCRSSNATRRSRERSSRKLRLIFYAGAALPQDLWERLEAVSVRTRPASACR